LVSNWFGFGFATVESGCVVKLVRFSVSRSEIKVLDKCIFFKRLITAVFQINLQAESLRGKLIQISTDDVKEKGYPEALATLYHGIE